MDTRFIESFVAVVEKGSFAEAARRLNLSPAGIAQQLRTLEREIGKPLVVRTGRTVAPTEVGLAILDRARYLLRQVRELKAITTDHAITGELRLGAPPTVLAGVMPKILASFTAKYPQVKIYLVSSESIELYHTVLRGDLDAALLVEPRFAIPKTCTWTTLRTDRLVALTPLNMPPDDTSRVLMQAPFIRYDRSSWGGQIVDSYLRQAGLRPKVHLELSAINAIAALVAEGIGVSLVPDWSTPWGVEHCIRKLPVANRNYAVRVGLLAANKSPNHRLTRLLHTEALATYRITPAELVRT
jgi:DNA-binding transcriptional LysR family regulator